MESSKHYDIWFNKREKFLKKLFPNADFEICIWPNELDTTISTEDRIILLIDRCCGCSNSYEKNNKIIEECNIPENQIAVSVYKKDKRAISMYDCIEAIVKTGWKRRCDHYFFEGIHQIKSTECGNFLYKVFWGS